MKKQTLKIAAGFGLLMLLTVAAAQTASAQTSQPLKANIPFEFSVGEQTFPAGEYTISCAAHETSQSVWLIRSDYGHVARLISVIPDKQGATRKTVSLVFNRYGEKYFLSRLRLPGEAVELTLKRSKAERTLSKELAQKAPERAFVALTALR